MAKKNNPKSLLEKKLAEEDIDYDEILELAHALAKQDEDNIRFSIDASLIDRLGRELVAKQETAISELVKNAYDADATIVKLLFADCYSPGGYLEFADNGHGMTRDELINGFMRISTRDKSNNPVSKKYKRSRAGRKGIGRFAAQRLGRRLTVLTQTRNADHALKLTIEWDDFEGDTELYSISNQVEEIDKFRETPGTKLIIEGLREAFPDALIDRSFRFISELIQPFPLSRKKKPKKGKAPTDPGFKAIFKRKIGEKAPVVISSVKENIYKHALAVVEGRVDSKGRGTWSARSNKIDISSSKMPIGPDQHNPKTPFPNLRDVHIKAYYFLEVPESNWPSNMLKALRSLLFDHGGIRLYRNGFRVLPYGEKDNDWLGLDWSYRRRKILAQHGNSNWLGFLEVIDEDGHTFEETASREGVLENKTYEELITFAYGTLTAAAMRISELRGKKSTTKGRKKNVPERIKDIASKLEKLESEATTKHQRERIAALKKTASEASEESERELKELIEENEMLRVLSGMGLSISEFTHEIRFLISALEESLDIISDAVPKRGAARTSLNDYKANVGALTTYSDYFHKTASDNINREIQPLELRDVTETLRIAMDPWLKRRDITLETSFDGYDLFTKPMHPSEWSSILLNLCTNSVKAIGREGSAGKILIACGGSRDSVYLEFSDTGDGIPKSHKDRIFNPFFTTSLPSQPNDGHHKELTSTGLGLKIVRDIINHYDGEIKLVAPTRGFATTFRIEIPRATKEEIPDDA